MRQAILTLLLLGSAAMAEAQETSGVQEPPAPPPGSEEAAPSSPPPPLELAPITVSAPAPVTASSELLIPGRDFELRPQGRPADILRVVPGLLMSQHQGGGKAEQYLLRGFDADHGTDIALFVDGLPVNLRSHAHGQGYADLHFLIPETLRQVETFKGPYFVEFGDFATAGAINFVTLDFVPENIVQAAGGSWGTQRYLMLLSPTREQVKSLFAMEVYTTNGPFERAQDYIRLNIFAKVSASLNDVDWAVWASYLNSNWFSSGQIPTRAVREGLITRFGSIDDSEGGNTQRFNGNFDVRWKLSDADTVKVHGYGQYYQLNLFSDFTFFLDDPVNGDEIKQVDTNRAVAGLDLLYEHRTTLFGGPLIAAAGFQFRVDTPRVILAHTHDRQLLDRTQDVNIFETSYSPLVKFDLTPLPWLRVVTGARGDIFNFNVHNNLVGVPDQPNGSATKAIPSAKVNTILGPWYDTEFFANLGTGFHSNDARAVVQDPNLRALAQATGWEFGVRTKILPNVEASFTYWWLNLTSELVFNGDTATLEPSGASRRNGFEFQLKAKLLDWLTFTGNVTNTPVAEFFNGAAIPLAPRLTAYTDLTARLPWGLSASTTMRFVGPRYADEERTQTARGYTLVDLGLRYRYNLPGGRALDAFLTIENLFNVEWREAQFYFTSRLPGEPPQGVNDIHYTPGNPRTFLGGLALRFYVGRSPARTGAHLDPGQPLEHLDHRRPVFLVEASGARHLVDLLADVGQQERHPELLGKGRLQLLVLERDVHGTARAEVAGQDLRHACVEREAVPRAHAHHVVDHAGVEAGLDPHDQRLAHGDGGGLHQHVVHELERQSLPDGADMEQVLPHRREEVATRAERLGRAADQDGQLGGRRPHGAAAHRGIEHGDALRGQVVVQAPRDQRIDRAHAHDDVAGPRSPDDTAWAGDDGLRLRGRLHHRDHPPRVRRHLLRRADDPRPLVTEGLDLHGIDVMDHQREPGPGEVLRHGAAHVSETDEANGVRHSSLLVPGRGAGLARPSMAQRVQGSQSTRFGGTLGALNPIRRHDR